MHNVKTHENKGAILIDNRQKVKLFCKNISKTLKIQGQNAKL